MLTKVLRVDGLVHFTPEVHSTNGKGVSMKQCQTNAQIMSSYRF